MDESNMLELRGIIKEFPGVRAIDDVSFELLRAEVHAVVGENGAGKSTLMNIVGGVLQPDAGEILIEGKPVQFANAAAAGRRGIAVVFQELSLVPELSIAENIFFNRQPVNSFGFVATARLYTQTKELLSLFNLALKPTRLVKDLSMGNRQLIEVLKAISLKPKILILDEPTSSLGAAEKDLLFGNIRRMKSQGVSFLYISHHLPEIFQISDRVTVLRDGKRVGTFQTSELSKESLVKRMVGRELTNMYGQRRRPQGEVCFRYERLNDQSVALELRSGEILGMAGLIGSGRSELAQEIVGIVPNSAARVYLDGQEFSFRHPAEAIQRGIVYLTEDRKDSGLYLSMSVQENCAAPTLATFANSFGFLSDRKIALAALTAKQDFNIATPSIRKAVSQLSGGNQQKVLLAMWIGAKPHVLIVDEPTRGVDVGAKSEIYHLLRHLAEDGVAILMISSELQEILGMSDRIIVFRAGRKVAEYDREQATEEGLILAATGVGLTPIQGRAA
jgi:ABC-type sugar transport system ATPase subunit